MILITSGLGFIGSHVTRALLDGGHDVLATTHSRREPVSFLRGREGLTVAHLDVLDPEQWNELGSRFRVDAIVHLATAHGLGDPLDDLAADLRGFANAIRFARGASVSRLIYASSIGVYADVEPPYREDMPLPPLAPHGIAAAKKTLELAADLAHNRGAGEIVGVRIGGAWGPLGNPASRFIGLPRLIHAAIAGESLQLHADIACDLIYIDDVANAIVSVLTAPRLNHPIYNIGSGRIVSDREVGDAVRQFFPSASLSIAPDAPHYVVGPLNIDRLTADTGFTPRIAMPDGLKTYAEWLRTAAR